MMMFRSARSRVGLLILLLTALFGLLVWYGTLGPNPAVGAYPGAADLGRNYGDYLGNRVVVVGRVIGTDPIVIATPYGSEQTLQLTITDTALETDRGNKLRVFGTIQEQHTIRVINAFTIPATGLWYTWSVSFLAGVWVFARLIRNWQVACDTWELMPRQRPLLEETQLQGIAEGDDNDA